MAASKVATIHNITDNMGKSRKRTSVSTFCCCKSQKRGKQTSHRRFRRREQEMMHSKILDKLPYRQREIVDQWDLGGDGKRYWRPEPTEEWFIKLMRK